MYDFYSDTKSMPTNAMLESIVSAPLGDEQKGEDPTTTKLEARVAELLGKEAAVFMISGTMCNEIAVRVHCRPGDEVICDTSSHLLNFECGSPAALSGVVLHPLQGINGIFGPEEVRSAVRPVSRYMPASKMVLVEQTANLGGGAIWPLETLDAVIEEAKSQGLVVHMDGARLLNAVAKTGVSPKRYARDVDTVWIDFSKGLGAPCGAVLAGSVDFCRQAWRQKQGLGGAMRQSGVLAAACLYALDNHIEQQSIDNDLAASIGQRIVKLSRVANMLPVATNIIVFDVVSDAPTAAEIVERLKGRGVLLGAFGERRLRAVTCLNVDEQAGDRLVAELTTVLRG
ncbi:MAG: threonine aldolase family protein [Arenicellales bacterium]|mgnify:CR=1 FL=1|nr:low specificity L-threonine aldolase [Pseudomonadota bacterium]MDP6950367.1 threonine aldolase family protein [Arenicellales bacterium]